MAKRPAWPRDPNQLARLIMDIATGEAENIKPAAPHPALQPALAAVGEGAGKEALAEEAEGDREEGCPHTLGDLI